MFGRAYKVLSEVQYQPFKALRFVQNLALFGAYEQVEAVFRDVLKRKAVSETVFGP